MPGLCVLASSSSGNCSVLALPGPFHPRVVLLDLGLGPKQLRQALRAIGLDTSFVTDVVLTHLDLDHFRVPTLRQLPKAARLRLHRRHLGRAEKLNALIHRRTEPFDDRPFSPLPGREFAAELMDHDAHGSAAFRIDLEHEARCASIGWATDLGRPSRRLTDHLAGVDVLAIESNYCPQMQQESDRPAFLKRRIMEGAGHLSNAEAADAVRTIAPRRHVVLLHLSRQCNTAQLAAEPHKAEPYDLTIARHDGPTPWLDLSTVARRAIPTAPPTVQLGLFEHEPPTLPTAPPTILPAARLADPRTPRALRS